MTTDRRSFITGTGAAAMALRFGPIWAAEPVSRGNLRVLAECKTVFFGASAYAVAAASLDPAGCVIIERNLSPAAEFSGALLPNVLTDAVSEAAKEIRAHIEAEGLAAGGRCHTPPVSDVVSAFILKKKINVFFNAEITAVRPVAGGYEVQVIGSDGRSAVRCGRIVDTTPYAWKDAGADQIEAKHLSAALIGDAGGGLSGFSVPGGELHPGALEGETYFRVRLPHDAGWTAARLKLHETFEAFAASGRCPFKMGAEATEMGYVYRSPDPAKRMGKNWDWTPGARWPDLMAALNGGASWS